MSKKTQTYYGRNVLKEALAKGSSILEIFVETKSAYDWVSNLEGFNQKQTKIIEKLPKGIKNEAHQGIAFRSNHDFYEIFDASLLRKHHRIVLCNHIEDVHNLGSIVRCAAAFGAGLIIHEESGSATLTPAAVKASVGCAFRLSFSKVPHLNIALRLLQKDQYEIIGLEAAASSELLYEWKPSEKLALILGAEGSGIESSVRSFCNRFIAVPMEEAVDSLNVSHAFAIAMSWIHQGSSPQGFRKRAKHESVP